MVYKLNRELISIIKLCTDEKEETKEGDKKEIK